MSPSIVFFDHSTAGQRAIWNSNYIILSSSTWSFFKVPSTRQEAKGVDAVISKILITRVNKLGTLSQQAHTGLFTRDLTSQQKRGQVTQQSSFQ